MFSSLQPWTVARQAPLSWDSPGKNTGVGGHFLLQKEGVRHENNHSVYSRQQSYKGPEAGMRLAHQIFQGCWRITQLSPERIVVGVIRGAGLYQRGWRTNK